jgi:hypothetical protein
MDFIGILIPVGFVSILVIIIYVISSAQLEQRRNILDNLKNYHLDKVNIRFLQSSVGKGSIVGGMPIKAEMYISDNFLLITPKGKGYYNGFNNLNLPVTFVKNETQKNELNLSNIIVPDSITFTNWHSFTIKYQKQMLGNIKYRIQINALDKKDNDKIDKIKEWYLHQDNLAF